MKDLGYDVPLYILPFDHRGTFQTNLFGWKGSLSPEQTAQIAASKQVIYDGFKAALAAGVAKRKGGILVDEQFGTAILRDAATQGYSTSCPAEKSGQQEFDFEYGEDFASHIERFQPTFCKVLVRYNPEGDADLNRRQSGRLKRLSDFLRASQSRFMFELLVPPTEAQLARAGGDKNAWDVQVRPRLMVKAIEELQDAQVEADVWKIEGLDRHEDCEKIVATARRGGRDKVGCIVLGRGEDERKVREWLTIAAGVPGFIGFAVGRTTFWSSLVNWRAKKLTRDAAVAEIAGRFRGVCRRFRPCGELRRKAGRSVSVERDGAARISQSRRGAGVAGPASRVQERTMANEKLVQTAINTIRTLSMDAVQKANSGHPGTPMGMAPVMYCLWQRFLRFDPDDPIWPNRDRFVLSVGHASMLLYSMLYLTGVKAVDPDYEIVGTPSVSLDDIKSFRQLGSRCAGHPEYRWTSGVETTTGPLGQGVANSVGMAIASKWLGARYNRPGFEIFTNDVYALCGDGCMMEGIFERSRVVLAGHLGLDNLCWIYDNNRITIEGSTARTSRFAMMSRRRVSCRMAGTSPGWVTPTTSTC